MTMQNGFKEHLLNMLTEQRQKRAQIESVIQREIQEVNRKIEALETTLRLYEENHQEETESKQVQTVSPANVAAHAKKIGPALEYIARHQDGVVQYARAAETLRAAGIGRGKLSNLKGHVYRIMQQNDDWEKISPGTFRFLKYTPTLFSQESLAK
jgi:hypothetical protein